MMAKRTLRVLCGKMVSLHLVLLGDWLTGWVGRFVDGWVGVDG